MLAMTIRAWEAPRILYLAHDSPGRLRFRFGWLRDHRDQASFIADELAALDGVDEVQVRPFTGSVLVGYDSARIGGEQIRRALCRVTGVDDVTLPGQETVEQIRQLLRDSHRKGSELARVAVRSFQGINVAVLSMTNGHVSLGALTSLMLWLGAAWRFLSTADLQLPEWHQMAWWGFRSFFTLEEQAIETGQARTLDELWTPSSAE
jgi:hypothetical protein